MIVKDEEACLARCLASVRGADELVVVDTGSTDRTREIAESFGARLYDFPWVDDFAAARNESLRRCTGEWVLIIDADWELAAGGIDRARRLVAGASPTVRTFSVNICTRKGNGEDGEQVISAYQQPLLFRRCPEVFWKGAIHNHLSVDDRRSSDLVIWWGYSAAHKQDPNRAMRILTRELARDPLLVREAYYLAREHWYRKDYAAAEEWYGRYLKRGKWAPEMADAWLMRARCLFAMKRGDEARDCCLQALKINVDFREALLFMAKLSGPKNRSRWERIAEGATNEAVLFVRVPPFPQRQADLDVPAEKSTEVPGVYRPHADQSVGCVMAGPGCVFHERLAVDGTGDVTFGAHCLVLRDVRIHTHRHAFFNGRVSDVTREHRITPTPLRVGSNVVLAEGAVIMPGVGEIGDDAVVGAHSVLTHSVGAGETWAGNPARRIRHRDDASGSTPLAPPGVGIIK